MDSKYPFFQQFKDTIINFFQQFKNTLYTWWEVYDNSTAFEEYFAADSKVRYVFRLGVQLLDFTIWWGVLPTLVFLLILRVMAPLIFFLFPAWPIRLKALSNIFYTVCRLIAPKSRYSLRLLSKDKLEVAKQKAKLYADLKQLLNQWRVWNRVSGSPEGEGCAYFRKYINDNKERGHEGLLKIWVDWLRIRYKFNEAKWDTSGRRTNKNKKYKLLRSLISLLGSFLLWVSEFPLLAGLLPRFVSKSPQLVLLLRERCWLFLEKNGIIDLCRECKLWIWSNYRAFGFNVFRWGSLEPKNFVSQDSKRKKFFEVMLSLWRMRVQVVVYIRWWWKNRIRFWAHLRKDPRIHIWLAEISVPELRLWLSDGLAGIKYVVNLFVYPVSLFIKLSREESPLVSRKVVRKFGKRKPSKRKVYFTLTPKVSVKSSEGSKTIIKDIFNFLVFLILDLKTSRIRYFWCFFWAFVCAWVAFIVFMKFWTVFPIVTRCIGLGHWEILRAVDQSYLDFMEGLRIDFKLNSDSDNYFVLVVNALEWLWNQVLWYLFLLGKHCWFYTCKFNKWFFDKVLAPFLMFFFWLLYTRYPLAYVIFWMLLVLLLATVHILILHYCFFGEVLGIASYLGG